MRAIGIDVGGTAIKFALVSDGEVLLRAQCPTPTGDPPALAKAAATLIRENAPDWEMLPIGFACAGDVDPKTGLVSADNLGWQNVPLGSLLREALGRDVLLEQDTHAAMMAEWANGSLKGEKNALYLTIGTGVGGGAILDGRPYREIRRPGSEFGHMITHAGGLDCPCGGKGCYERYASTKALIEKVRTATNKPLDAFTIFEKENLQDPAVRAVVDQWIDEMILGLTNLIYIFNPPLVILGGGVINEDYIIELIDRKIYKNMMENYKKVNIVRSKLGSTAGLLGAAYAAAQL